MSQNNMNNEPPPVPSGGIVAPGTTIQIACRSEWAAEGMDSQFSCEMNKGYQIVSARIRADRETNTIIIQIRWGGRILGDSQLTPTEARRYAISLFNAQLTGHPVEMEFGVDSINRGLPCGGWR